MLKFEAVNPEGVIRICLNDSTFKLKDLIDGKPSTIVNADYNKSMFEDNMIYIFAFGAVLAIVFLMIILSYICRKYKEKI